MQRRSRAAGFTLIEVMVVVVILAILAAVVVPKVMEKPGEARVKRAQADITAIVTALNTYKLDNFNYPSTEQGLQADAVTPSAVVADATGEPAPVGESMSLSVEEPAE